MGSAHPPIIKFHAEVLPRATKKALDFLSQEAWLKRSGWYLAGGTALALVVGHRSSVDLDFFSQKSDFSLAALLRHFPKDVWLASLVREGTVYGELMGAKISFISYPFFIPKEPYIQHGTVQILSPRDIAVMKIIAISQRGRKRDFVDLYWYCRNREPLLDIIRRLPAQYPTVAHDYHHIMKALMYFEDAEADPMPRLFFNADWKHIKAYFRVEVPKAAKEVLGLS